MVEIVLDKQQKMERIFGKVDPVYKSNLSQVESAVLLWREGALLEISISIFDLLHC